jgi:1,4-dihydroxy-2-naphthoyl-CoA hydrolase
VEIPPSVPFERTFDALYGLEVVGSSEDELRGRVDVRDAVKQPWDLVHGGVYASMADSLASRGTLAAVRAEGKIASAMSNQTSFLRPITEGHVNAVARARHRGRTTWVWEVEFFDDHDRLCALSRMTIAVRSDRESSPGPAVAGSAGSRGSPRTTTPDPPAND